MTTAQRINLCILEKRIEKMQAQVRKMTHERNEARAMARDMRNQLEKNSRARLIFPWENDQGI